MVIESYASAMGMYVTLILRPSYVYT